MGKTPQPQKIEQTDQKVLRISDGIETVKQDMLTDSSVERVIIPNSVENLGEYAFYRCKQLREVIFEPGSRMKTIKRRCFKGSKLRKIIIPKNV